MFVNLLILFILLLYFVELERVCVRCERDAEEASPKIGRTKNLWRETQSSGGGFLGVQILDPAWNKCSGKGFKNRSVFQGCGAVRLSCIEALEKATEPSCESDISFIPYAA